MGFSLKISSDFHVIRVKKKKKKTLTFLIETLSPTTNARVLLPAY